MINIKFVVLLLIGVFVSSISQVFLKKASLRTYDNKLSEYLNPMVVFAYILFFCATLLNVFAYKGIDVSLGPVLEATSYIYVTIFSVIIFKEKLNTEKLLALILILVGILAYSYLDKLIAVFV